MATKRTTRDRFGVAAAWVLAGVLPLAASPTPTDPGAPLRLMVLGLGLGLGLLAVPSARLPRPAGWALAAALAVFAVAAALGRTPALSLLGRFPRYEGLPVVAGYAAAVWIGAQTFGPKGGHHRDALVQALSVATLVNAVLAVGQVITSPELRVTGMLGNSTTLGTFGLIGLAVLGWRLVEARTPLVLAGFIGAATILTLSASRGALLGAVVAAATAVVWRLTTSPRPRWWAAPALGIGLVAAMLAVPTGRGRLTGTTPFAESTITGRLHLWSDTWQLILTHPWVGVGPSRFVDSISTHHGPAWAATVGPYAPPDSPHLVVLQVLASTGTAGLAACLLLSGTVVHRLLASRPWDLWQAGAVTAATAVFVSYLTSFTDPVTTTLTALLIGGAISSATPPAPPRRTWQATTAAVIAALLGLYLGGTSLLAENRYSTGLTTGDVATLTSATNVRPWDADLARRVGYTLNRLTEQQQADPQTAVDLLTATCPRLPGSVECLHTLADAHDLAGNPAAALTTLDAALTLEPTNVDTHLKRGISLANLGRFTEAETAFQDAAALRPTAPEPWRNLAHLHRLQGRTQDAEQADLRAAELATR